jgi:hypothetical protein
VQFCRITYRYYGMNKTGREVSSWAGQGKPNPTTGDIDGLPFHRVSEGFGGAEGADYCRGVALVGVYFGVEVAHVFGGDFAR